MGRIERIIYDEFKYPIQDYYKNLRLTEFIYDLGLPFLIALLSYSLLLRCMPRMAVLDFTSTIITLVSILVGFSIAAVTILAGSDSGNVNMMKDHPTERKIGKKRMNLFQLLSMFFVYGLISEFAALCVALFYYILFTSQPGLPGVKVGFALILFFVLHVIFLTVRGITSFYFVLTMDRKSP